MRFGSTQWTLGAAVALAAIGAPAAAEPRSAGERLMRLAPVQAPTDRDFSNADVMRYPPVPLRHGVASFAVTDRVDLYFSLRGKKDKSLGEPRGRQAEEPAGRSSRQLAKVGVLIRW